MTLTSQLEIAREFFRRVKQEICVQRSLLSIVSLADTEVMIRKIIIICFFVNYFLRNRRKVVGVRVGDKTWKNLTKRDRKIRRGYT